ncbi:MAG: hypothetical protein HZC48_09525 [Nitrospirae bacterium]|nr:hypothetical protein [Nitrospirota bacterium]
MTVKKIYALLIVFLLIAAGCAGKDKVKQSADSVTAQNALSAVDLIKDAYLKKDEGVLREKLEPALSAAVTNELSFDKADLKFTPRMIKIKDSSVLVHVNWQGEWTVNGRTLKDRGVSALVFNKDSMKLIQIDGDNIFHVPSVRE